MYLEKLNKDMIYSVFYQRWFLVLARRRRRSVGATPPRSAQLLPQTAQWDSSWTVHTFRPVSDEDAEMGWGWVWNTLSTH